MKTIKINHRLNLLILGLLILMGLLAAINSAFGQIPDKDQFTQQEYGDETLVEFDFESWGDTLFVDYIADKELIEVINTGYSEGKFVKASYYAQEFGSHALVLVNSDVVFFRTPRGVTSLMYVYDGKYGYVVVNGKVMRQCDEEDFYDVTVDPEVFRKNKMWSYNDKRFW